MATLENSSDTEGVFRTVPAMRYINYVIGGLGMTGNIFVVIIIMTRSTMRKQLTNTYIINQSMIDTVASLLLILSTAFEYDGRKLDSILDVAFCKIWLSKPLLWGFFLSSTYNLLALTVERYLAIVHPIWHKLRFTKQKVVASVVFVWLFGPIFTSSYVLATSDVAENGLCRALMFWPNEFTQHAVGLLTVSIQYLVPLSLFIFLYTSMITKLRQRVHPAENAASTRSSTNSGSGNTMERARKNLLKTLVIVVCSFIFCWTWNQTYYLLFNLGVGSVDFSSVFYNFTVVMVFMNCCVNPFIYAAKYEEFQVAMRHLFRNILFNEESYS